MRTTPKTNPIFRIAKGQKFIAKWLRKLFGINEGTRTFVYQQEGSIVFKSIASDHIKNLRGSLESSGALKSLMDSRRREREL